MNPQKLFCPNMDCPARGQIGKGNLHRHSLKDKRCRCGVCGQTFVATTGTIFYRLRHAPELVIQTIEVGPVPLVPYAEPLTQQLAQSFEPFLPKYNNFLMENHGPVSMSRFGIKETLMLVELLEMSAKSILLALQVGDIKELDYQAVKDLGNTMRTRGLPLFGAPGVNKCLEELYFG